MLWPLRGVEAVEPFASRSLSSWRREVCELRCVLGSSCLGFKPGYQSPALWPWGKITGSCLCEFGQGEAGGRVRQALASLCLAYGSWLPDSHQGQGQACPAVPLLGEEDRERKGGCHIDSHQHELPSCSAGQRWTLGHTVCAGLRLSRGSQESRGGGGGV